MSDKPFHLRDHQVSIYIKTPLLKNEGAVDAAALSRFVLACVEEGRSDGPINGSVVVELSAIRYGSVELLLGFLGVAATAVTPFLAVHYQHWLTRKATLSGNPIQETLAALMDQVDGTHCEIRTVAGASSLERKDVGTMDPNLESELRYAQQMDERLQLGTGQVPSRVWLHVVAKGFESDTRPFEGRFVTLGDDIYFRQSDGRENRVDVVPEMRDRIPFDVETKLRLLFPYQLTANGPSVLDVALDHDFST